MARRAAAELRRESGAGDAGRRDFDDAATGQGLLGFFLRGSARRHHVDEARATGLTLDELKTRSFLKILQARRARAGLADKGGPMTEPLQFDKAEYAGTASGTDCTQCQQPLAGQYYEANGALICGSCKASLEAARSGGSRLGRFAKSLGAGLPDSRARDGDLVRRARPDRLRVRTARDSRRPRGGGAVRAGSNARGGWAYQALAMFLTYASIVSTYVPDILKALDQPPPAGVDPGRGSGRHGCDPCSSRTGRDACDRPSRWDCCAGRRPRRPIPEASGPGGRPRRSRTRAFVPGSRSAFAAPFLGGFENIMGIINHRNRALRSLEDESRHAGRDHRPSIRLVPKAPTAVTEACLRQRRASLRVSARVASRRYPVRSSRARRCHRLVHADTLRRARRGGRSVRPPRATTTAALMLWRRALELVPPDSTAEPSRSPPRLGGPRPRSSKRKPDPATSSGARHPVGARPGAARRGRPSCCGSSSSSRSPSHQDQAAAARPHQAEHGVLDAALVRRLLDRGGAGGSSLGLLAGDLRARDGPRRGAAALGIPATAPMFIPGLGAFVRLKQYPPMPSEDARVGLAGPVWGLAATLLACCVWPTPPVWGLSRAPARG